MRKCNWATCSTRALKDESYCLNHLAKGTKADKNVTKAYEAHRFATDDTRSFYNSKRWRDKARQILKANIWCVRCNREFASEVDHRVPLKDAPHLALTDSNLDALCSSCHSTKSLKERKRIKQR